jgi:uncharacterized RDD family membrane protein YckC
MQRVEVKTAQNVSLDLELAGVGTRVIAAIIDYVIVFSYLITTTIGLFAIGADESVTAQVVVYVPVFTYFLLFEIFGDGQSVGKYVMKIRVRRLDGGAPGTIAYLIRWLVRPIDIMFTSGMIGLVAILSTNYAQRLGDIAAGTTVVRKRQRTDLRDLSYAETEASHPVTYPQVDALSDEDIRTAQEVLNTLIESGRSTQKRSLGRRTRDLLARKMGIETEANEIDFLRTVIADYGHVHRGEVS